MKCYVWIWCESNFPFILSIGYKNNSIGSNICVFIYVWNQFGIQSCSFLIPILMALILSKLAKVKQHTTENLFYSLSSFARIQVYIQYSYSIYVEFINLWKFRSYKYIFYLKKFKFHFTHFVWLEIVKAGAKRFCFFMFLLKFPNLANGFEA